MTFSLSEHNQEQDRAARETARILLDIGAVNFRPETPYILTSGRASPVYIDCRRLIAFPPERRAVMAHAERALAPGAEARPFDAVAGGETAGIPYAAWLAERMNLPMLYVRKQPKGFGRMAQIEGLMTEGQHVLLVEDLATDGGSKLNFVNAIRSAGGSIDRVFVVFYYGIFPEALDSLKAEGVELIWLATWADILAEAEAGGDVPPETLSSVRGFLADPHGWSAAHGGKGR